MRGTDKNTGKPLSDTAHLRQSIADVLTTPIGSRVMRRDYGSRLFSLIDSPADVVNAGALAVAVGDALARWEPRFRHRQTTVQAVAAGQLTLRIFGAVSASGEPLTLDISLAR